MLQRFLELIFGLPHDPGSAGVEKLVAFNPPSWMGAHAREVNAAFVVVALAVVGAIYFMEGRRAWIRVGLGVMRLALFLYVVMLINRPVLRVTESHTEPSVIAILLDHSISMDVHDVDRNGAPTTRPGAAVTPLIAGPASRPAVVIDPDQPSRLEAVVNLLGGDDAALLRQLAKVHQVHLYTFDKDAKEFGSTVPGANPADAAAGPTTAPATATAGGAPAAAPDPTGVTPQLLETLRGQKVDFPNGNTTQVVPSMLTVLDNLQGQRLAGVVVITDARETPTGSPPALLERLRRYGVKVYPVSVGSDRSPMNIDLVAAVMQDSAFKGDIVTAKLTVRGTGYEPNHPVTLRLRDKKTGLTLPGPDGKPAQKTVQLPENAAVEEELLFKPEQVGVVDVEAVADEQDGELNRDDNVRPQTVAVLDAEINVLYVDGYPRWEYRYIKNEMIRDETVNISCLLTSADQSFIQEGDDPLPFLEKAGSRGRVGRRTSEILQQNPNAKTGDVFPGRITRFPESMDEMMKYDVVLFGDVDSRQFTDKQLQMVSDFVSKKGGGFGMVSGPKFSPIAYRNTPVEAVLPVNIARVLPEDPGAEYKDGWRPVVTDEGKRGEASTIFRFFTDPKTNDKYIKDDLQPVFWFLQGATVKQGVGLVYAEHPMATDPTGRKAPVLVLGRFGAGRTLFSAIDDSWRWRYYTGESVFDTYWVQQLRYLARSKKLGQRRMTFGANVASYQLGDRIELSLKVLDPVLLQQLPPQFKVDVTDERGQVVQRVDMIRQEVPPDLYTATFSAGTIGSFSAKLPQLFDGQTNLAASWVVMVPKLELSDPTVNPLLLSKLAAVADEGGQVIPLSEAKAKLPEVIKSAAKTIPVVTSFPLWNKWRALIIFMLLLTGEWVLRKVFGML